MSNFDTLDMLLKKTEMEKKLISKSKMCKCNDFTLKMSVVNLNQTNYLYIEMYCCSPVEVVGGMTFGFELQKDNVFVLLTIQRGKELS